MTPHARIERLWRDVDDDSPWYEKALFHAIGALWHGDDAEVALRKINAALVERPSEVASDEERPK